MCFCWLKLEGSITDHKVYHMRTKLIYSRGHVISEGMKIKFGGREESLRCAGTTYEFQMMRFYNGKCS